MCKETTRSRFVSPISRVRKLFTPVMWHSGGSTPPTHAVFLSFHHDWYSPTTRSPPSGNKLAVFTNLSDRDGSFSHHFSLAVCLKRCMLVPHHVLRVRVACFNVLRHLLPNLFNRFPRPKWHILFSKFTVSAHFWIYLENACPLDIIDPPVHLHRPVSA